ncbi:hypothetical protein TSOC111612_01340 [Tsukamurella ocularis]|uniref:hypothetical protein n=1 Tax=Tsukamurella ocularis TaxID=1970234 RepID=UPI0039EFDECF
MKLKEFWRAPGGKALSVAAVGVVLVAVYALWPLTNPYGTACGSWLFPDDSKASLEDFGIFESTTYQVDGCQNTRSGSTGYVLFLAGVTVVALVVGLIQRYKPRTAVASG